MKTIFSFLVVSILVLNGCSTPPPAVAVRLSIAPEIDTFRLSMSDVVRNNLSNNAGFNELEFEAHLKNVLLQRKLLQIGSKQVLDVVITDLRARGWPGVYLGDFSSDHDYLKADVSIKNSSGITLKSHVVELKFRATPIGNGLRSSDYNFPMNDRFSQRVAAFVDPSISTR